MRGADVRAALATRWPAEEFITIPEAPEDSGRQGRKIDLLVISLWRSRGLERQAVEIKVTVSDWRRELKRASKADFWWRHSNRFWIAVPSEIASTVKEELPDTWGLLACTPDRVRAVVKAAKREAEPLSWQTTVGLMRAAGDAGVNALNRVRNEGFSDGYEKGIKQTGEGRAGQELKALRERVQAFEAASGVSIMHAWDGGRIGEAVALIQKERASPGQLARQMKFAAQNARNHAASFLRRAEEIEGSVNDIEALLP